MDIKKLGKKIEDWNHFFKKENFTMFQDEENFLRRKFNIQHVYLSN